jgi:hypothetical protein
MSFNAGRIDRIEGRDHGHRSAEFPARYQAGWEAGETLVARLAEARIAEAHAALLREQTEIRKCETCKEAARVLHSGRFLCNDCFSIERDAAERHLDACACDECMRTIAGYDAFDDELDEIRDAEEIEMDADDAEARLHAARDVTAEELSEDHAATLKSDRDDEARERLNGIAAGAGPVVPVAFAAAFAWFAMSAGFAARGPVPYRASETSARAARQEERILRIAVDDEDCEDGFQGLVSPPADVPASARPFQEVG